MPIKLQMELDWNLAQSYSYNDNNAFSQLTQIS
jgi:hypothetical protein